MATTINSSRSLKLKLSIARSISWLRSYVVTTSTPSGRLALSVSQLGFNSRNNLSCVLPERRMIAPPATSPSPLSSDTPRRISGPICTRAISRKYTGTPCSLVFRIIWLKSSSVWRYPLARTIYFCFGHLNGGATRFLIGCVNRPLNISKTNAILS